MRHGQTVANVARQLDTLPPGAPLTEEGERQAEALGEDFVDANLAALVSSTALRAKQTATPTARTTASGLEVVEGIYEIQAGDLEGRSDEEAHRAFVATFKQWHKGHLDERIPGGESANDALGRFLPQIDELRAGYLQSGSGRDVVVVSHGAIIRLAVAVMSDINMDFAHSRYLANTEAVTLEPTKDGGWTVRQWGQDLPPFTVKSDENADDPTRGD